MEMRKLTKQPVEAVGKYQRSQLQVLQVLQPHMDNLLNRVLCYKEWKKNFPSLEMVKHFILITTVTERVVQCLIQLI